MANKSSVTSADIGGSGGQAGKIQPTSALPFKVKGRKERTKQEKESHQQSIILSITHTHTAANQTVLYTHTEEHWSAQKCPLLSELMMMMITAKVHHRLSHYPSLNQLARRKNLLPSQSIPRSRIQKHQQKIRGKSNQPSLFRAIEESQQQQQQQQQQSTHFNNQPANTAAAAAV